MESPAVVETLSFSLLVRPARAGHLWQAELGTADGRRIAFTTPLELLRYLADLAGPHRDDGGLR